MKLMTVQEYAAFKDLTLAGVYKQIKEGRVASEKKFGRLLVRVKTEKSGSCVVG